MQISTKEVRERNKRNGKETNRLFKIFLNFFLVDFHIIFSAILLKNRKRESAWNGYNRNGGSVSINM